MHCSHEGQALIQKWEGIEDGDPSTVNLDPYLCPASVWTIGWGHAVQNGKGGLLRGELNRAAARAMYPGGITIEQARLLLAADLVIYEKAVARVARKDCSQQQFDAMVALCFNIGIDAFIRSTVAVRHAGGRHKEAADAFGLWVKATVKGKRVTLQGLVNRRADERALYLKGSKL